MECGNIEVLEDLQIEAFPELLWFHEMLRLLEAFEGDCDGLWFYRRIESELQVPGQGLAGGHIFPSFENNISRRSVDLERVGLGGARIRRHYKAVQRSR